MIKKYFGDFSAASRRLYYAPERHTCRESSTSYMDRGTDYTGLERVLWVT